MPMFYGLILITIIGVSFRLIETSDSEYRLINYLFSEQGYNPLIRPTRYLNETVVVSFGLLLVQLIHVNEKEQVMKTNTWLHMKWYDPQLRWNPEDYEGIDKINIPFLNVWTPDVVLFNNAGGNYEVSLKSKVTVMHTGEVYCIPPAIYKSSCRIDVKYFPFDSQTCEMRFASWTYNAREVSFSHYVEVGDKRSEQTNLLPQQVTSVTSDKLYKDDYLESGTWDVISIPSKFVHYRSNVSSVLPDYIEIVFLMEMRRKTLYYTVTLIVPIGLMSILICIVFCLPTAAGEKMTLCMSVLLALNLFQLLVTKILPPTSAVVPLIAKYLLFTFTLNVLVIVNTVVITNFYYRTHTMSFWIRRIFLQILPPLLWMESPRLHATRLKYELPSTNNANQTAAFQYSYHTLTEATSDNRRIRSEHTDKNHQMDSISNRSFNSYINDKRRTSTVLMKPFLRSIHLYHRNNKQTFIHIDEENRLVPIDSHHSQVMRRELIQALTHIRFIAEHYAHKTIIESIRDEWKFIATVIDRLQFVIFSIITIIGSLALFFQVPRIFHVDTQLVRFSNPNLTVHELLRSART